MEIRWTTTIAYRLVLDEDEQAEWEALDDSDRDSWLADKESDDTGFDAVQDRDWVEG